MTTSSTSSKPILIAGAGLSSLLLAKVLHRNHIPIQVFERDETPSFRAQGYRLRISEEGLAAIEEALGPEWQEFYDDVCGKSPANISAGGITTVDALTGEQRSNLTGEVLGSSKQNAVVVGAARGAMRNFFMRGLEDLITWGKKVEGYEDTEQGVRLVFADGTKSDEGCLLVGGEGIASKVSRQMSGGKMKVYDTGYRSVNGQAPSAAFKGLRGAGVFRVVDTSREVGNVGLICNIRPKDMDDPSITFGWTVSFPPVLFTSKGDQYAQIGKPVADFVRSLVTGWHPSIRPMVDQVEEDEAAFWKIAVATPTGIPEWDPHPRVATIGDAVHLITPAGGLGASTAVRDSALLGRLIVEAGGWKEGLTAQYEKEMRVYANEAVHTSWKIATTMWKIDEEAMYKNELFGPRGATLD